MTSQTRHVTLAVTIIALALTALLGCSGTSRVGKKVSQPPDVPAVPREFRGVWVATVANIDWPSEPGLPVQQQQDELIAILDKCVQMNFNAVVLQVRPAADALYASDLEPWSSYLTGEMGEAPRPYYDPLAFAVGEAHRRGLELHAWFNPYRALHPSYKGEVSDNHISKTHPKVVYAYGPYLWMDPSEPAVQRHSLNVILDVVRRYDIDGIHLDDYFYPYKVKDDDGNEIEFPDDRSWSAYQEAGGKLGRSDWRRKSVDDFIQRLYESVKDEKPHVQVGISPFGIWKPGHPAQIKGFNQYEGLFADARKWLVKGWVDYFTPQLYWEIAKPDQSFTALLGWWAQQNKKHRHLWPGIAPYRTGKQFDENEIKYQIQWTRIMTPKSPGTVHFSMQSYMDADSELAKQIRETVYAKAALPPATPWLGSVAPAALTAELVEIADGSVRVKAEPDMFAGVRWWVVQVQQADTWVYAIVPATDRAVTVTLPDAEAEVDRVIVSAVSRTGVQGVGRSLDLPKPPMPEVPEQPEQAAPTDPPATDTPDAADAPEDEPTAETQKDPVSK